MQAIKCVIVGDENVDKVHLVNSYSAKSFPGTTRDGKSCKLELFDTSGQEDYDRIRPLSYSHTKVFLVCFSVVVPSSFKNAKDKWVPEIKHHCQNVPFLLVGTQIDLRDNHTTLQNLDKTKQKLITLKQGEKLAKELKAVKYIECSTSSQEGLSTVFDEVIRIALEPPQPANKKGCQIL